MSQWRVHGSCVSRNNEAVLVVGPPGSGKSDLALRLIARGFELVADDQVDVRDGIVSAPAELVGLLEARGLGIMRLPYCEQARLALIVDLGVPPERMPSPLTHPRLDRPVIRIEAAAASAPERVTMALDCVLGRVGQLAGAFVA